MGFAGEKIVDDLLDGVDAIADFTGIPKRRIYAMTRSRKGPDGEALPPPLPFFRLPGSQRIMARKSELAKALSAHNSD